jgi:co-chaperonin GroES (HSP10)
MSDLVNRFKDIVNELGESIQLIGDCVVVEKLPKREIKTSGGIVLSSVGHKRQTTGFDINTPEFVRVLWVGPGYFDEEGKDVPLEVEPGNIIEIGKNSVNWFSSFGSIILDVEEGKGVGICRPEHRIKFNDYQSYEKFIKTFEK